VNDKWSSWNEKGSLEDEFLVQGRNLTTVFHWLKMVQLWNVLQPSMRTDLIGQFFVITCFLDAVGGSRIDF
jgi:hypothetical protein